MKATLTLSIILFLASIGVAAYLYFEPQSSMEKGAANLESLGLEAYNPQVIALRVKIRRSEYKPYFIACAIGGLVGTVLLAVSWDFRKKK